MPGSLQPTTHLSTCASRVLLLLLLAACGARAAPLSARGVVVVRLGSGSPVSAATVTAPVFIDEYDADSGAVLQTFEVPTHLSAYASPNLDTAGASDGCKFAFTVYECAPGTANTLITGSSTFNRVAVTLSAAGVLDVSTYVAKFPTGTSARGTAISGSNVYMITSTGVWYIPPGNTAPGATGVTPIALNTMVVRNGQVFGGDLYFSNNFAVYKFSGLPTTANAPSSLVFTISSGSYTNMQFLDSSTIFVGTDTTSAGCLSKSVLSSGGTWAQPVVLGCPAGLGVNTALGVALDARGAAPFFWVTATTSAYTSQNWLLKYFPDSNTYSTFTLPTSNTIFKALAVSPTCGVPASPTPAPARPTAGGAFSFTGGSAPTSVLALLAGDGTSAGSPVGSSSAVAVRLKQFVLSGSTAAPRMTEVGASVDFLAGGTGSLFQRLTIPGDLADRGSYCGLLCCSTDSWTGPPTTSASAMCPRAGCGGVPLGGQLMLSSNGRFASVIGYDMSPGTSIGLSNSQGSGALPPPEVSRVIGVLDGVTGEWAVNFNASVGALAGLEPGSASFFQNGSQSGWYISGGYSSTTTSLVPASGGLFAVPAPSGSPWSVAARTRNRVVAPSSGSPFFIKRNSAGFVYLNQAFAIVSNRGVALLSVAPGNLCLVASTTLASGCNPREFAYLLPATENFDVRGAVFTSQGSLYVADADRGLSYFNCASLTSSCGAPVFTTPLPGTNNNISNGIVSVSTIKDFSSGQRFVVVATPTLLWLWPVSNDGAWSSFAGNCCGAVGNACCFANDNSPVANLASPETNFRFRSIVAAPVTDAALPSPSASATPSPTSSTSVTPSASSTASISPSPTPSVTPSPSSTTSESPTMSPTTTPTLSATPTASLSPGASASQTSTTSVTGSITPSQTRTPSQTPTKTSTPSQTPSPSPTSTLSASPTSSVTPSRSPTPSTTRTPTSSVGASPLPPLTLAFAFEVASSSQRTSLLLDEAVMCSTSVLTAATASFDAFFGAGAQTTILTATVKAAGSATLDCMQQYQRRASEGAGLPRALTGSIAGVVVTAETRLGPATSEADQRVLLQALLQLPPQAPVFGRVFAALAARLGTNATDFSATLVTSKTSLSSGVRAATVVIDRGTCWDSSCWTATGILGAVIFAIGVAFLICLANYYRVKQRCPPLCGKSTKREVSASAAPVDDAVAASSASASANPLVVLSQRIGRQLKREESAVIESMDEEDFAALARFKAEKAAARAAVKEAKAAAAVTGAGAGPAAPSRSHFQPVSAV